MKNKKGFTLVELLAVIVILALIMSIAVISIGGLLERTRQNTFKSTAATIIDGVRTRLLLANKLEAGDYEFTRNLLESGGENSPLGGDFLYRQDMTGCTGANKVDEQVCKVATKTCSASEISFVRVTGSDNAYTYSICLTAGANNRYIDLAEESEVLDANNSSVFGS